MLNPIERGSTLIAAQPVRFKARSYLPGDKFDYRRLGITYRRTVANMLTSRKLTELTDESMKTALRFRPEKAGPPRGFTLAGLRALGILSEEQIAERGWDKRDQNAEITDENADAPAWAAPEGSWKVFAEATDEEQATDDTTLWIVPFKTGGATRYFVHDLSGERLSGEGSLSGKDKTEAWARQFMADRAAAAAAKREGDPDWSAFPENPDDWTDDQVAEFDAFYDALQPDAELEAEHPAVTKLFEERRAAEKAEAILKAGGEPGGPGVLAGLSPEEANELLEAMTEDELRAHVGAVTGKDPAILAALAPLALREMAIAAQPATEGSQNGGDVQSGADV